MAQDEACDTHKKEGDVWNHIQRVGDTCKIRRGSLSARLVVVYKFVPSLWIEETSGKSGRSHWEFLARLV
jgi:hypothetical protein